VCVGADRITAHHVALCYNDHMKQKPKVLHMRVTPELHKRIAKSAKDAGVSITQLVESHILTGEENNLHLRLGPGDMRALYAAAKELLLSPEFHAPPSEYPDGTPVSLKAQEFMLINRTALLCLIVGAGIVAGDYAAMSAEALRDLEEKIRVEGLSLGAAMQQVVGRYASAHSAH